MSDPARYSNQNSLLRSLLTDHLDPGYAAAHEKDRVRTAKLPPWLWLAAGCVLVGLVVGIGYVQTGNDPDDYRLQLLSSVKAAERRTDELAAQRSALAAQADQARATALAGNDEGTRVLDQIRGLESAAGVQAVHGPGVTVTLADHGSPEDRSIVLDRDLQAVVNALWQSGAEAVSVGDVRVGPAVTVRQAGGAMLVDNRPVPSPYRITAIGSPAKLQTGFVVSPAYLRMSAVAQLYGIGFDLKPADDLQLPAATVHELREAKAATR